VLGTRRTLNSEATAAELFTYAAKDDGPLVEAIGAGVREGLL
jgi:hypothetical protein